MAACGGDTLLSAQREENAGRGIDEVEVRDIDLDRILRDCVGKHGASRAIAAGRAPERSYTGRCSVCASAAAMRYGISLHLASQSQCSRQSEGNQPTLCAYSVRERVPDHRPLKIGIAFVPLVRVKPHAEADA